MNGKVVGASREGGMLVLNFPTSEGPNLREDDSGRVAREEDRLP